MLQKKFQSKTKSGRNALPILREVEIIYNRPVFPEPVLVSGSKDAYAVFEKIYDHRKMDLKEFFFVLLLDRRNYSLGCSQISVGSTSGTVMNIKEIFQLALKANASGIIVSHNHPSGNPKPSEADIEMTKRLYAGAKLLDMTLLDHIIMTSISYLSMSDEELIV